MRWCGCVPGLVHVSDLYSTLLAIASSHHAAPPPQQQQHQKQQQQPPQENKEGRRRPERCEGSVDHWPAIRQAYLEHWCGTTGRRQQQAPPPPRLSLAVVYPRTAPAQTAADGGLAASASVR